MANAAEAARNNYRIIFVLALLLFTSQETLGLKCLTCNYEGTEPGGNQCVNNPASIENGWAICQEENDEYCYTSRLEDGDDGKITLNRGCCKVKEYSSVCPPGGDDQYIVNEIPPYTMHLVRCKGDLCNKGTGDGNDNTGGDVRGGSIIVNGRSNGGPQHGANDATAALLVLIITAFTFHLP